MELLESDAFLLIGAGGEGSGKSWSAGLWATAMLLHLLYTLGFRTVGDTEVPVADLCWVVGVTYEDAYKDYKYILEFCERLDIVEPNSIRRNNEGKDKCSFRTKYGQLIETMSGGDPTNIAREEPFIIVGAEASRWSAELWKRAHGRLERRSRFGSRGIFTGSFEAENGAFYSWHKTGMGPNEIGIRSFSIPSWSNPVLYPGGYDDPAMVRLRLENSKARFMERYGGKPAPPGNAVLKEFNAAIHVDDQIEYLPDSDVYIAVDPGENVYSVLFVQAVPEYGEFWVMDEIYAHRSTHENVIKETTLREGWKSAIRTRRVVIDVAGYQEHASEAPADIWRRHTGFWVSGTKYKVEGTVDRLRTVLSMNSATNRPRLRIHPRCRGLISEMGGGPSPVEGGGTWVRHSDFGAPKRENDHSCKALGYMLQEIYGDTLPTASTILFDNKDDFDAESYLRPTGTYSGWRLS